ncbi:MAG: peptidylprolyl isomerase [Bacteroidetes bacterium]|nr:MAG: peptidylprolyl isomerase [Bacteroidota bacterium]
MSIVKQGDVVSVHYTGTLTTGEEFDSSVGRAPLEFTVGAGQMIAGFDAGVVGMAVGDKKVITMEAADAYGEWEVENAFPFPKANIPADLKLEVGMELTMRSPDGSPFNVTVAEIQDENIILDANHHLAGKALVFNVEMLSINGETGQSRIILLD